MKRNFKRHEESKIFNQALQATTVVTNKLRSTIKISVIFCPLSQRVQNETFPEFFQLLDSKFIVGGDWNSKHYHWGSRIITSRGRILKEAIDRFNCNVLTTGKPAHWLMDINEAAAVLDFFVYKGVVGKHIGIWENYHVEGSHLPIIDTVSMTVIEKKKNPALYNKRTDWESYQKWLEENLILGIPAKIATDYITRMLQKAAWKSTIESKTEEKINNYPLEIRRLIAKKR